jgi:hypothetical protein
MQREDNVSKILSTMRMSSDFTLRNPTVASLSQSHDGGAESPVFQARKTSSIDFSELEVLLARARNPVLTQLHKAYTLQFATMTAQIAALTRELADLKAQHEHQDDEDLEECDEEHEEEQDDAEEDSGEDHERFDRQISLDVASASETSGRRTSRPVSQFVDRLTETPFWKVLLEEEGEEWDPGVQERRGSLRCVSPMTMY